MKEQLKKTVASSVSSASGIEESPKRITCLKDDVGLRGILENNREWVKKMRGKDPQYFDKLALPQNPEILYLGCSDSRVPADQICGLRPGEVFVHRNVANLAVVGDSNFGSVLHYAVATLDVKHIMVVGHYDCGGVRAAMNAASTSSDVVDGWLMHIRDVYRLHQAELDLIEDDEERHRRLVELNVIEQCINVFKFTCVQKKRQWRHAPGVNRDQTVKYVYPRVHGLVFDPKDGILKKLDLGFRTIFGHLKSVYKLEEQPDGGTVLVSERWTAEQNSRRD